MTALQNKIKPLEAHFEGLTTDQRKELLNRAKQMKNENLEKVEQKQQRQQNRER